MCNAGGFADQEAIELGEAWIVLALNRYDVDAELGTDLDDLGEGLRL